MSQSKENLTTIDEYISSFSKEIQNILIEIRRIIKKSAPNSEETISYQIPTYKLQKKNLVHFAAFKKHIGFYPSPSGITAFKKELEAYETSKGTIKFPLNHQIPYELIQKIVEFRVKEILD
ncbi:MAG: hypothetical protein EU530_03540 [Promethearchaeota archaeon]|nr:MAG: hypothetical protein EU530_03540 [Candidatus Lokiarchaeota archaeon]